MKLYYTCLFIIILISACNKSQEKIQVTTQNISESVYASGVIKSKNQYQVFTTVNGIIKKLLVTEGDTVRKGQAIISVLNESSVLSAANAKLAAQFSELNANEYKLNELKSNLDFAESKMKNDSSLYQRQKNLWSSNVGSKNDLDQRELAYKNSMVLYKNAVSKYKDVKRQLDLAAQQSKNNLEISNTLEADFTIKSEADGKVYSILKEEGELVSPQSPMAVIGDANEFILELQVDEYDISKIKVGQKIFINLDSYKGKTYEARVEKINPAMNERSRSFKIDASFVSQPKTLYPFLTAEANIVIQTKEKALLIPRSYLIEDSYVLNENNEKIKVTTGLKDYDKVEILTGLNASDYILKPIQ